MQPIIPSRLREARIQAGLSLSQAAMITGLAKGAIERFEWGVTHANDLGMRELIEAYGVSEAWLRGEETPLELTPEHLDQLANLSPANREHIIDFLISIRGRE